MGSFDFNACFDYKQNLLPNFHLALDGMACGKEEIMIGNNGIVSDDAKIYGLIVFGMHFFKTFNLIK